MVRCADASAGAPVSLMQTNELCSETDERQVFIVLVDDNPADVLLVREALSWHDVKSDLLVARDGDEAIRVLDEIDSHGLPCPDLVVLDLNLPRKNGFEVLQRIRSAGRCRTSPVAILSSSDALSDRKRADLLGASQYFQKPSNLQDFMSIGAKLKDMLASAK
jgi:DNA-binding response OmpR family regulator